MARVQVQVHEPSRANSGTVPILVHRLGQRSRTAVKAGAAVVRRRDGVRARRQLRCCVLCLLRNPMRKARSRRPGPALLRLVARAR